MKPSRAHDPDRIRRKRIEAGLNLPVLAEMADISKGHLSKIERGVLGTTPRVLKRLAQALNCEIADLMPPESTAAGSAA